MSITSLNFALFALLAVLGYQATLATGSRALRSLWLCAANLYFLSTFSTGSLWAFAPMFCFLLLGYAGTALLRQGGGRARFWLVTLTVLAYFFWLKRYSFVPTGLLLTQAYVGIGTSYMFFRIMQLLIDAGSGNIARQPGLIEYTNYLTSFTTLISGPIQRYEAFAEFQQSPARLNWIACGRSIERICIGAFKVLVLAGIFRGLHLQGLAELKADDSLLMRGLVGAQILAGYTLYLYCNFSGYTDIVVGVARWLGVELPENFDRPFSALNFMDFWARWHMTLSNWLKTYVYNSLAKQLMARFPSPKVDPYIGVFAFLVTFFLIGLWHGQTAVFALYGLLLGIGVSGNKLYQIFMIQRYGRKVYRSMSSKGLYQALARGITFTYFNLSLVCFWAGWAQITELCGRLGWAGVAALVGVLFAAATLTLDLWERLRARALNLRLAEQAIVLSRYTRTAWSTALIVLTAAVVGLTATPAPDIIYKNF